MIPEEIIGVLRGFFGDRSIQPIESNAWQVDTPQMRMLLLLSPDGSWLRLLVPIAPAQDAQPYLEQLLEANFDLTQDVRYALNQGILWGVFQHSRESLTSQDLQQAIAQLVSLHQKGLSECFKQVIEERIRAIVKMAKRQGQTLETTLQTLTRFYEEGMLGGIEQSAQEREQFLAAWQEQLERFWLSGE